MADQVDIFERLRRPFPTSAISWRVGATNLRSRKKEDDPVMGIPLAYIDARDVMDRLDEEVGPANWQDKYSISGTKTICAIGINVGAVNDRLAMEWVWKEDGAGDTDMEAEKGALSDAFKRAAVRWGIGRYLYSLKSNWVVLEMRGQTPIIPDAARKELDATHDKIVTAMEWGERADREAYRLLVGALPRLDTHMLEEWQAANEATIKALPVAMRANLLERIEHIGAASAQKEAAE